MPKSGHCLLCPRGEAAINSALRLMKSRRAGSFHGASPGVERRRPAAANADAGNATYVSVTTHSVIVTTARLSTVSAVTRRRRN